MDERRDLRISSSYVQPAGPGRTTRAVVVAGSIAATKITGTDCSSDCALTVGNNGDGENSTFASTA
jgi:hypothetical protein